MSTDPEQPAAVAEPPAKHKPDKPANTAAKQPGPTAPIVELVYVDGDRHINGIPAADLTRPMVDRVVYLRTAGREVPTKVDEEGNPAPDPEHGNAIRFNRIDKGLERGEDGFDKAREQVVDWLVGTGIYRRA